MRLKFLFLVFLLLQLFVSGQNIKRINGTSLNAAQVTGAAINVFNNNQSVFSKTFGFADLQNQIPLSEHSEMYAASLAKMVFAYVVMQLVQEKIIDPDKPLATLTEELFLKKVMTMAGYITRFITLKRKSP